MISCSVRNCTSCYVLSSVCNILQAVGATCHHSHPNTHLMSVAVDYSSLTQICVRISHIHLFVAEQRFILELDGHVFVVKNIQTFLTLISQVLHINHSIQVIMSEIMSYHCPAPKTYDPIMPSRFFWCVSVRLKHKTFITKFLYKSPITFFITAQPNVFTTSLMFPI